MNVRDLQTAAEAGDPSFAEVYAASILRAAYAAHQGARENIRATYKNLETARKELAAIVKVRRFPAL